MKQLLTLTLILFLITPSIYAGGDRVGNGGNIVHCKNKVALLDFFEGRDDLRTFDDKETHESISTEILKNLERLNNDLAHQYRKRLKAMQNQILWRDNVALTDQKDSLHLMVPLEKDCHIQQIAIRQNLVGTEENRFVIDQTLWKQLSPRDQAGLLFHEVIYEHFYKLGESNSVKARELVRFLFSKKSATATSQDLKILMQNLKIPIYWAQ